MVERYSSAGVEIILRQAKPDKCNDWTKMDGIDKQSIIKKNMANK